MSKAGRTRPRRRSAREARTAEGVVETVREMAAPAPDPALGHGEALVLMHPPGHDMGRRFVLDRPQYVIGRSPKCDIHIDFDSVSRQQARLWRADDGWHVEDLGSTNGSFLDDDPCTGQVVRAGNRLRFGRVILKFLAGNLELAYHDELYRMSILDPLTEVHNKRFFGEYLARELPRAARHRLPLSLLVLDIDHFKQVNDDHGHLAGDHVLKGLCRRIQARLRGDDLLGRIGGEEFACLLANTAGAGATILAEALRVIVERDPFEHAAVRLTVTISVGVAALDAGEKIAPADFLDRADKNLYAAKHAGRNRVVGP